MSGCLEAKLDRLYSSRIELRLVMSRLSLGITIVQLRPLTVLESPQFIVEFLSPLSPETTVSSKCGGCLCGNFL